MTLKPLNQAEANLKFNSPIPKASISAPVSPALMTWMQQNKELMCSKTIRKQCKYIERHQLFLLPNIHSSLFYLNRIHTWWTLISFLLWLKGRKLWSHLDIGTVTFFQHRASSRKLNSPVQMKLVCSPWCWLPFQAAVPTWWQRWPLAVASIYPTSLPTPTNFFVMKHLFHSWFTCFRQIFSLEPIVMLH